MREHLSWGRAVKEPRRVGLFLGRFQPLHAGHLQLITRILFENNKLIVCIGSAQKADPFTIKERHKLLEKQVELIANRIWWWSGSFEIIDLVDPNPISKWPMAVKKACHIKSANVNTFYRSDELSVEETKKLQKLGFVVKQVPRRPFMYRAPDGLYYFINSSTDIKNVHRMLRVPLK